MFVKVAVRTMDVVHEDEGKLFELGIDVVKGKKGLTSGCFRYITLYCVYFLVDESTSASSQPIGKHDAAT